MTTTPDPNERFQMYTREANSAVATLVKAVLVEAEDRRLNRQLILLRLNEYLARLEPTYGEIGDTEPPWAIVDEVNEFLDKQGIVRIHRDDLNI